MTTRKAIVLITRTFGGKVMALLFKMLSRLVSTLATSWEGLTHWKRPWCWDGLGAGGEGDNRRCRGWMASPTRWTWVWVNSRSWWWAGRPGVLQFMGSQRVGHNWATELNWTEVGHNFSSKEQASFNFMAVVIICSDSGTQKIKSVTVSPSIYHEVMGPDAKILVF